MFQVTRNPRAWTFNSPHTRIYNFCVQIERWSDIESHPAYQVSSLGNIKYKKTNKLRKINYDRFRQLSHPVQCTIRGSNGRCNTRTVARLVLKAFDPREDQDNLCAFHIDGDRYNNRLDNLEWRHHQNVCRTKPFTCNTPVKMENESECFEFESLIDCHQYLKSTSIVVNYGSVLIWCKRRCTRFGYAFMYRDESKYVLRVQDLDDEEWRFSHCSPNSKSRKATVYYVSSLGRVKSVLSTGKERLLTPRNNCGYLRVNAGYKSHFVHRLVARCFVDNPNSYCMVDHLDGNRHNNDMTNLRWVENCKHNWDNPISRLRASQCKQNIQPIVQIDPVNGSVIKRWDKAWAVQRKMGYGSGNILRSCRNERCSAYGYIWRFASDFDSGR